MRTILKSSVAALTLVVGLAADTSQAAGPANFTVTFNANGEISGTLADLQLVDDLRVAIEGTVELQELTSALLTHCVIRNDRSKMKEVWLNRLEIVGDELVVRGGARYEDRMPLPFGGWTKLYSQSGSVEVRLRVSAVDGVPSVRVTRVDIELGGLLGDVVRLLDLDGSIERIARPMIQAEISRQIVANVPSTIGQIGAINVDGLSFVSLGERRYGIRMVASASISLS